jgi:hypothetical protein
MVANARGSLGRASGFYTELDDKWFDTDDDEFASKCIRVKRVRRKVSEDAVLLQHLSEGHSSEIKVLRTSLRFLVKKKISSGRGNRMTSIALPIDEAVFVSAFGDVVHQCRNRKGYSGTACINELKIMGGGIWFMCAMGPVEKRVQIVRKIQGLIQVQFRKETHRSFQKNSKDVLCVSSGVLKLVFRVCEAPVVYK